jgi:hypothetical protein
MKLDRGSLRALIVAFLLVSAGSTALFSGEFHTGYGVGQNVIIYSQGPGARVLGVLLIGLGVLCARSQIPR